MVLNWLSIGGALPSVPLRLGLVGSRRLWEPGAHPYVENAVESLELAERLASSSDRRRMLKLAEAWVELANGTHDRGCHPPSPHMHDHALAKAELGGYHLDR